MGLKVKSNNVNEAVKKVLDQVLISSSSPGNRPFKIIRLRNIARELHPHIWKHRSVLVKMIQKWYESLEENKDLRKMFSYKGQCWELHPSQTWGAPYGSFTNKRTTGLLMCMLIKSGVKSDE